MEFLSSGQKFHSLDTNCSSFSVGMIATHGLVLLSLITDEDLYDSSKEALLYNCFCFAGETKLLPDI